MTHLLFVTYPSGRVSMLKFDRPFDRALAVIALANQPVVVTTADVDPEA